MGHVSSSTLIVVGLAREARLFHGSVCQVAIGGANSNWLRATLAGTATTAITEAISFGLAAGLRPGLPPGALVLAETVFNDGARFPTDADWRAELREVLPDAQFANLAGVDEPVASAPAKASLFRATGAAVADMESHIVAHFARERRLRFAVIRAVADPAERALPPAAMVAIRPGGKIDVPALARSIVSQPNQFGALIRLGLDARAGMRTLDRAVRVLQNRHGARTG